MEAIMNFIQETGFYRIFADGNFLVLVMMLISFVLMYLAIVKKFEPLLLLPIAFGMLITNLPGAEMYHEILWPAAMSTGNCSAAHLSPLSSLLNWKLSASARQSAIPLPSDRPFPSV